VATDDCAVYLDAAVEAVRRAGQVLSSWRQRLAVRQKAPSNLVTDADFESQRVIRQSLSQRFPSHRFIAEEDESPKRHQHNDEPTWIIDPLDGTTNYVHGCPGYCISIGLQVGTDLAVGVILDPCRDELFHGGRGLGAWLGAQPLKTSRVTELADALVGMESPYDPSGRAKNAQEWAHLSVRTQAMRQLGSTALDLAYVAAGRLDAFWGPRDTYPWDVAAGAVLIQEAGGIVTNREGEHFNWYRGDILASNGMLHARLVDALKAMNEGTR
jgi:myo-inositol-1(or 4)-monophosphatase